MKDAFQQWKGYFNYAEESVYLNIPETTFIHVDAWIGGDQQEILHQAIANSHSKAQSDQVYFVSFERSDYYTGILGRRDKFCFWSCFQF